MAELLYGIHPVREALRARRRELVRLRLRRRARPEVAELEALARAAGVPVEWLGEAELAALAGGPERTQGVLLEAGPIPELPLEVVAGQAPSPRRLVALDGVEDPQNVGAVARVAEAAGAAGLVLTARRAPPLSPALSRASAGAVEHLPVARVPSLPRALKSLKEMGFWIFGADPREALDLFAAPDRLLAGDGVLVLGAEGRGLRPGVRGVLDQRLAIPMRGRVASLNVAAAGAVVLFEWLRRDRRAGRA